MSDAAALSPRRWLVINPNTDPAITQSLVAQIERHVPAGTRIVGATAGFGFPVIATRVSFAIAAHAALDAYARHDGAIDAIVLGCFGDPGLAALRELSGLPVVGLAEASFAAVDAPFAVLTSGAVWRAMLLEQIAAHPHAALCRGVLALEATGAEVSRSPEAFVHALDALAAQAVAAGAESLILGGAVLAGYAARLRPIARFIDCAQAAAEGVGRVAIEQAAGPQPHPATGLSRHLAARLQEADNYGLKGGRRAADAFVSTSLSRDRAGESGMVVEVRLRRGREGAT